VVALPTTWLRLSVRVKVTVPWLTVEPGAGVAAAVTVREGDLADPAADWRAETVVANILASVLIGLIQTFAVAFDYSVGTLAAQLGLQLGAGTF